MSDVIRLYTRVTRFLETRFSAVLLLAIRGYWGSQFALTGWGKLQNADRVAQFFDSLGIPMPHLNVYLAGGTEFLGGIALFLGLGARLWSVPLIFTMTVAYLTSDWDAASQLFSNPDAFVTAAPFLFLLASLIVLTWGPGPISLDHLVARRLLPRDAPSTPPA